MGIIIVLYASAKPIYGNWNFLKIPSRNLTKLSLAYEMDFADSICN